MAKSLKIGIIGEFDVSRISQVNTVESLDHASKELSVDIETVWLPTTSLEQQTITDIMLEFDAVWAGPGDYEDADAAILAIKHCRDKQKPFFAT